MDWILKRLRISTGRQVVLATLAITAISVAAPVGVFAVLLAFTNANWTTYLVVLSICAAIPLLIAPPISLFALSILRLLTLTIDKVDAHVRIDPLTGVSTRASFLGMIRERLDAGGCFLMIDADHFKSINDTYGHDVGDQALQMIGEVLAKRAPKDAVIGRLGGEEFGVFLTRCNAQTASEVAAEICSAIRLSTIPIGSTQLTLTVSIGCAQHVAANSLEATMKLADNALYRAKKAGRDNVQLASHHDARSPWPEPVAVH